MDREDVAHIYNGISLSHKKEQNWVICNAVDEPRVCQTERSKLEREKQISYINAYRQNLEKNGANEPICRTGTETQFCLQEQMQYICIDSKSWMQSWNQRSISSPSASFPSLQTTPSAPKMWSCTTSSA